MVLSERREHVREAVLAGKSQKNIAQELEVSRQTIRNDVRALREAGQLPPHRQPPPTRSTTIKSVLEPTHRRAAAHPATVDRAQMAKLRAEAFDMKIRGDSLVTIARHFKRDAHTIGDWVQAEIEQLIIPRVETLRQVEVARLEKYLVYLEPKIRKGDDKAVNAAIRVSEQLAKLLGLHKPVKIDATVHEVDKVDVELTEMINQARAKEAAREQKLLDGTTTDDHPDPGD